MNIIIVKDALEGGKKGLELFENALNNGAEVIGLATGSTPITFYNEVKNSNLDLSDKISINLDEYCGVANDHPQSYHYFMQKNLFDVKPFKESYVPDGANTNEEEACGAYNTILEENPIDFQILGIGTNGHIGFNEPGSPFNSVTRKVDLTPATIEANARFFESEADVPKFAYSMGIKNITDAKEIVLFAYGKNKQEAVKSLVEGAVTEDFPASILQNHDNVTIIIDEEASALLK